MENIQLPDFLFEVSWEVCNKVGGIHTVVATKAFSIEKQLKDNYILIGPDLDREGQQNPEFEEDKDLFKNWKAVMQHKGLKVRTGRWNILGKPIVFLVDFSPLFSKKDEIFTDFWNEFKLDSLSGQWDYIEPAMFGYAAGMVIKNFYLYHLSERQKIVAQFHEWMTGTGLLYLKKYLPQVATVFTTHATVLGRSVAGNNLPLYSLMENIDLQAKVKEFNITAKHSLESISAQQADIFTTVSEITAKEAEHFLGKKVDIVTPNGFEDNITPTGKDYEITRSNAHNKLRQVAEALLGYKLDENVHFIATSGRYEFKNKGIDVFIDAVAKLNEKETYHKEVVAFILVPANNYGPRKDLLAKLQNNSNQKLENPFITHYLHDADFDPVLKRIREKGFTNNKEEHAKIIFVPAYLNGNDGIFNIPYYDLLPAFRMTAFPSYYEPWGYTPLESLAFHVPTITTTLAGFGLWIKNQNPALGDCLSIIERNDNNYNDVVEEISGIFITCTYKTEEEQEIERNNSYFISKMAQWKNLVRFYFTAYKKAISNAKERTRDLKFSSSAEEPLILPKIKITKPFWRTATVKPDLPEKLKGLEELSKNIWWEWNSEAIELFRKIDEKLWQKSERNPVKLLKEVGYNRLLQLQNDPDFINHYEKVYSDFKRYINEPSNQDLPAIAYFSMEYGLTNTLKIYSGGLGILAGDYLKQASDKNIRMVAVGLMYKYGYFTQKLSIGGDQIVSLEPQNFSDLPMEAVFDENGQRLTVSVGLPGRLVYIQIWKVNVGRIPLFLLDTDIDKNNAEDRKITHQLYGGDNEHRLKQEIVLGIGGIRALRAMKIRPDVYHSNEGHSAFIGIERVQQYMAEKHLTFAEAVEVVRASTLFTTHTPVPAGHDVFPEELMMQYFGHIPERVKITWEDFIKLGKINPHDKNEKFSMSHLACNLSQEINGVSYLHGEVTKKMFNRLWEGYYPDELHIGYVTNGVHYQTWAADKWKKLINKHFSKNSTKLSYDSKVWNKIYDVPDEEIWQVRNELRNELIDFIKQRINSHFVRQRKSPQQIVAIQNKVKPDILTLGFARRFATYKRAHLLFYDTGRFAEILNNPERPVQIIFAGKAHPADIEGQQLIKRIVEISKLPQFLGKIIFLENYDIELAKKLVQGVDVWINTPTRPLEASGTSGMKATMNGVLHFSVLDGWWVEGYKQGAGWALPMERTYENQEFQNQLDAEMLYETIENEIVPIFYNRDNSDIPRQWISYIKKAIAQIAPQFTTARMLDDYINKFYIKLAKRKAELKADDYATVKELSAWKKRMLYNWDKIDIIDVILPTDREQLVVGKIYDIAIKLQLGDINPKYIGVELIIIEKENEKILQKEDMKLEKVDGTEATFRTKIKPAKAGLYNYAFRVYPKHKALPNRQDFPIVMWV